jgi:hypothetical protein
MAFSYDALVYGLQECQKWGGCKGMSVEEYAVSVGAITQAQLDDYNAYLAFLETDQGSGWQSPQNIFDYLTNIDQWAEDVLSGGGEEGDEWTDDQWREYNQWREWRSNYGEVGDWMPTSIEDFYNNYDKAQDLLAEFQSRQEEAEEEREEEEEYQEYVREEAFHEPARLSDIFSAWMGQQEQFSGAFSGFVESEYPSLRGEWEAGMPIETGYPTREEAREAQASREDIWKAWLPEQIPGLYQEYMSQPPLQRGERPYMYQPTTRSLNW